MRRLRPDRRRAQLKARPAEALTPVDRLDPALRHRLVIDTNIYIMRAAGTLSDAARAIVDAALLFHNTVSLAELATGIGNSDPAHPRWGKQRDHYVTILDAIPANRILSPDADIWVAAGIIAGTLARTQGFQPHQRNRCLNDALIFLTAARSGIPVLTGDRDDFDLIQQVAGEGRFIHC